MKLPCASLLAPLALVPLLPAAPASAQGLEQLAEETQGTTVYDGDWLAVGAGLGVGPSYDGSDDYVAFPVPLLQGKLGGIGIDPRPAGLALDLIPDKDGGIGVSFGPSIRLRANRTMAPKDPVVALLPKLDRSIELGPTFGISIPKVLHGYDSLSFTVDARWDLSGASGGMVVVPSVTYFTPVSRGAAVMLSLNAERGDASFMDYYYSVSPSAAALSGLPQFHADTGWSKMGATALAGIDLNGDLTDGGLGLFVLGSYSQMLGDAAESPFTSERGSKGQFLGAIGLGYTF